MMISNEISASSYNEPWSINYCVAIGEVLKLQVRIVKVIKMSASVAVNF